MAIFLSNLMKNGGLPLRASHEGESTTITARIKVPSGTSLGIGDVLKIARVDSSFVLDEMHMRLDEELDSDGSPGIGGTLGYVRAVEDPALALDANTNPAVSGAVSTDDADYYIATGNSVFEGFLAADGGNIRFFAGDAGTTNEFAATAAPAGYADIAITLDAAAVGANTADSNLDITIQFRGPMNAVTDSYDYDAPY